MEKHKMSEDTDVSIYNVPNLGKGLSIMDYLSVNIKGKTLQEIKEDLKISQTTAYRILNTMLRHGYLSYNEEGKKYKLSCKLLTLGFKAFNENGLFDVVFPKLKFLRDSVKETACFGILGEKKGMFIEQVQGVYTFSFTLMPGKEFDLHCSAPGKAIMAYLPKFLQDEYLSMMSFERHNDRTITNKEDYLKELEKVRENGFAIDDEEELTGVFCIGAPVFDYKGYPCGAIWISGPKDRLPQDKVKNDIEIIKNVSYEISKELGYYK